MLNLQTIFGLQAGGAGRDRTGDLLSANQALSQLSYSPGNRMLRMAAPKEIKSRPIECGNPGTSRGTP